MVDFRPLLFINALAIMLLITAGFASIRDDADSAPDSVVATASSADEKAQADTVSGQSIQPVISNETTVPAPSSRPEPAEDDSEPVDTGPSPAINAKTAAEQTATSAGASKRATFNIAEATDKTPETAAPAAEQPETPPQPATGKLVLRSNVIGDQVLINNQPRGATRLDLELEPGQYDVVIRKNGFKPWAETVKIAAGDNLTLRGELEAITTVAYQDGVWVGGVNTGDGTYTDSDGLRYKGAFVDGEFEGRGTAWYPDGGRYQGDWRKGKRDGEGRYRGPDGSVYTGQFNNDQFNGQGTLTRANGDILSGHWQDNRLNGHGSLTSHDGLLYVGGFRNDRFHGEGSLTYPDGRSYQGEFSNGEFQGTGTEIFASGKKYQGEYVDGKFHGKGLLLNPNGSSIEATFRYGKPYGQVKLTTPEGEVFSARTSEPGVCYRENSYRATQCPPLDGW